MKDYLMLLLFVVLSLLAGFSGNFLSFDSLTTWYPTLNKPFFNPPNWIFGPVWSLLFILLGVSFWLVWKKRDHPGFKKALTWFIIQFVINILWTGLFFGLQSPLIGFIGILILLGFIITMYRSFKQIDKTAANLNIPYICWVSFATILNGTILFMNM